jgi:hypothetical protein
MRARRHDELASVGNYVKGEQDRAHTNAGHPGRWEPLKRKYALALGAVWLAQTVGRLLLFRAADTGTDLFASILHVALAVSLLGFLILGLSLLSGKDRNGWVRIFAAALLLGAVHAVLTAFDIYQGVFINLTGNPAPTLIVFQNPMLALSLLDNVGISPLLLAGILVALGAAHVLLYLPVAGLLLRVAGRVGRSKRRAGPVRVNGRLALLAASVGLYAAVSTVSLEARAGEPVLEGLRPTFQIAPPALLAAGKTPDTRVPRRAPPPAGSRPIVLIIVDALRRDRMGLYNPQLANTPFLNSLEASGKLRKFDAYATCTFSFCGVMSIFASRSWNDFGSRPETLVHRLADHSYTSHFVLSGQHANFGGLLNVIGGPVASVTDQAPGDKPGDRTAIAALDRLQIADPRHTFLYLHLISTHAGAFIERPFRADINDAGQIGAYLFNPAGKTQYARIYDLRVKQADDVLRRVFDVLRRKGMLDDALVVITSDHGQRTSEGGLLYHGGEADPPTVKIPLLIYDPRATRYPARFPASQIDVAPTILQAVGLPPSPGWKGSALQAATARQAVPVGTSESTGAVIGNAGKAWLYLCKRDTGKESVTALEQSGGRPGPAMLSEFRRQHLQVASPVRERLCRRGA